MTTEVILTGTGVPHAVPGRAGPGVLVRHGDVAVQFDTGRATVLRLVEAGCQMHDLDAVFITHVHSDHVIDLADVVMTRWIQSTIRTAPPLPILAVEGRVTRFVDAMLLPYAEDIALRVEHVQPAPPILDVRPFAFPASPAEVWRSEDGSVTVEAVGVHHEPVTEAVAYRITTPDGVVVISGDTRVCEEVRDLARGADVLVHEACRRTALAASIAGTPFETIFDYHADTVALGAMAAEADVAHLVLTHLIPAPTTDEQMSRFADDVRSGGFTGTLTVGRDLARVALGD